MKEFFQRDRALDPLDGLERIFTSQTEPKTKSPSLSKAIDNVIKSVEVFYSGPGVVTDRLSSFSSSA